MIKGSYLLSLCILTSFLSANAAHACYDNNTKGVPWMRAQGWSEAKIEKKIGDISCYKAAQQKQSNKSTNNKNNSNNSSQEANGKRAGGNSSGKTTTVTFQYCYNAVSECNRAEKDASDATFKKCANHGMVRPGMPLTPSTFERCLNNGNGAGRDAFNQCKQKYLACQSLGFFL